MKLKPLDYWQNQTGLRQVIIIAATFFTVVLAFSIIHYESFLITYDHGLFNQVFWNSLQGKLFQSSLSSAASSASLMDRQLSYPSYVH
jgi:Predicted membrane protein